MAERAGRESLIRGLFLCFLIHFIKLLFCVVASVCKAQPRPCVNYLFQAFFFSISDLSCVNYDLLVFS